MTVDLPHLSFSSRSTFLKCPKAWELQKVHRVPQVPSFAQIGGSAVHLATERIDLAALQFDYESSLNIDPSWEEHFYGVPVSVLRRNGEADQGEASPGWEESLDLPCMPGHTARTVFDAAFEECARDQEQRSGVDWTEFKATGRGTKEWPQGRDSAWWSTFGPRMVAAYVAWRFETRWPIVTTPANLPGVEVEVSAELGYPTKGYIDRLFQLPDGSLCVADLKTGTRKSPDLQLGEYASQIERTFGRRPEWGVFIEFPVSGDEARCRVTQPIDLSHMPPALFELLNVDTAGRIKSGVFPPNVTADCSWCYVRHACAAVGGPEAERFDPLYEILHPKARP